MGGFLTTHALDTSRGTPAANLKIDFFEYINGRSNVICSLVTHALTWVGTYQTSLKSHLMAVLM